MNDKTKGALITLAKSIAAALVAFVGSLLSAKSGTDSVAIITGALSASALLA